MLPDHKHGLVHIGRAVEINVKLLIAVAIAVVFAQDGEVAGALTSLVVLDDHFDFRLAILALVIGHVVRLGDDFIDVSGTGDGHGCQQRKAGHCDRR